MGCLRGVEKFAESENLVKGNESEIIRTRAAACWRINTSTNTCWDSEQPPRTWANTPGSPADLAATARHRRSHCSDLVQSNFSRDFAN
jgi:hypothetical protein